MVSPFQLNIPETGFYFSMNANTTLKKIRDLAKSKVLELQPFAGEEMNLPQTDPHRDGFIAGERTLAAQILALIDGKEVEMKEVDPVEEDMILSLGKT
jgi:hypothetical protein